MLIVRVSSTPAPAHVCETKSASAVSSDTWLWMVSMLVRPLSALPFLKLDPATDQKPIVFMCHSGSRTRSNADVLERVAGGPALLVLGGVEAWEKAGLPVERHEKCPLPMNRQIQIGAGSLVLFGLLASCVFPVFIWLSAFVGAGLIFAGLTGFCGMAKLLAKMPWNNK